MSVNLLANTFSSLLYIAAGTYSQFAEKEQLVKIGTLLGALSDIVSSYNNLTDATAATTKYMDILLKENRDPTAEEWAELTKIIDETQNKINEASGTTVISQETIVQVS